MIVASAARSTVSPAPSRYPHCLALAAAPRNLRGDQRGDEGEARPPPGGACNCADRGRKDRERAQAIQESPEDAPRDHRERVGAPAHAYESCARVDGGLDADRQEAQGNDDDSPLVQDGRALAGNGAVEPACDGADETLTPVRSNRARGGTSRQPIGELGAEENDHEKEDEEPDALACEGGDHGVDTGGKHDAPRVRLSKRSLS